MMMMMNSSSANIKGNIQQQPQQQQGYIIQQPLQQQQTQQQFGFPVGLAVATNNNTGSKQAATSQQPNSVSIDNFEQYLTRVQTETQAKVNALKAQLDKHLEQFQAQVKCVRKEFQKLKNESLFSTVVNNPVNNMSMFNLTNMNMNTQVAATTLNSLYNQQQQQKQNQQRSNNQINLPSLNNQNKIISLIQQQQHNVIGGGNNGVDLLTNAYNFSNTATVSWNNADHGSDNELANDLDDEEDEDDELTTAATASTAVNSSRSLLKSNPNSLLGSCNSTKRHLNKEQAQFNKFVRDEVAKKYGENFLLEHEVNQLETPVMDKIKDDAIALYLPKNTPPARAWILAKVSLRSLKRDLRRKKGIALSSSPNKKASSSSTASTTVTSNQTTRIVNNNPYYNI